MIVVAFIRWWYGAGWQTLVKNVQHRSQRTIDSFSVPTLARTLFAPWKRIVTDPGAGIDAKLRAISDNTVSRAVGFTVRLTVLLAAGASLGFMTVLGLIQILIWPLVPLLSLAMIIKGLL